MDFTFYYFQGKVICTVTSSPACLLGIYINALLKKAIIILALSVLSILLHMHYLTLTLVNSASLLPKIYNLVFTRFTIPDK